MNDQNSMILLSCSVSPFLNIRKIILREEINYIQWLFSQDKREEEKGGGGQGKRGGEKRRRRKIGGGEDEEEEGNILIVFLQGNLSRVKLKFSFHKIVWTAYMTTKQRCPSTHIQQVTERSLFLQFR